MLFTLQRYEFFSKSQLDYGRSKGSDGCCLPYKGTNFSANHNLRRNNLSYVSMLFTLQRYEFFSKSQRVLHSSNWPHDVVYPTKVRIFQQITTSFSTFCAKSLMLFTLQRYEFFSKSQLPWIRSELQKDVVYPTKVRIFQQITTASDLIPSFLWCCLPYKGTNFSANHNYVPIRQYRFSDVVYPTKVRIFQQITTTSTM